MGCQKLVCIKQRVSGRGQKTTNSAQSAAMAQPQDDDSDNEAQLIYRVVAMTIALLRTKHIAVLLHELCVGQGCVALLTEAT